ncbi:MAG: hypothetical protein ACJ76F_05910 [Bacteroidia bacterium]
MKKALQLTLIIFIFSSVSAFAQKNKKTETTSMDFNSEEFNRLLLHELNKFRVTNGLDSFDLDETVLVKAAGSSAAEMAKNEKADANLSVKTIPKRIKKAGGTTKGQELVIASPIGKGKSEMAPKDIVKTVFQKWSLGKKEKEVILNPASVYIGISAQPDQQSKRLYVSVVFGNFQSFNAGVKKKSELAVPFNTKSKSLKDPEARKCKNCEKFKDAETLQRGLYVENGKVYLKYDNLKNLKRLLKKSSDALAVDIVQKDQYSKADYNIMDNNLRNKGVMLKPLNKDKIFAKNLVKPDPKGKKNQKINKLIVEMGKLPKFKGPYELNLLIIQDGYVCKTVLRSYMEDGDQDSNTPLEMLPMPESVGAWIPPFEPRSESSILNFTIPFEKNKSEFKPEDVKPFLEALQEPDFIIDGLYIYAYSSIEGDSVSNARLQRKRAESVVKVLQSMQQNAITPSIITNDSWGLFQLEMEDGKYDYLTKMSKKEAIKTINSKPGLAEELEPSLAKERFAQIVMDVTYDISGDKEQRFSTVQFARAVKSGNFKQAYKIMDYIAKKVRDKQYTAEAWDYLQIPVDAKNAGVMMNKVYYDYVTNGKVVDEDQYAEIKKIQALDGTNNIVNFNALYCKLMLDSTIGDKTAQADMQAKIDAFYKTDVSKKAIDGLNIEWQFKIMDALDTLEGSEAQVEACIDKIKSFYNFKDATWQNALKLAYAFSRAKDYRFAANILEPYVRVENPDDKLLFGYIAIASHVPEKFFSRTFPEALEKAKQRNQEKYCKLFGEPYMSFQVLDNPKVKTVYREAGCN